ncbi:type II pantothenate kinase [Planococcus sp. X10-3]|uniref:type II pantothenate kinase n=1 Tax=Planococcus sp. X10-3 TaxID=3061240 RepID=UPI003BB03D22
MIVGIDAGGTLVKVAYTENGSLHFKKYLIAEMEQVASWVNGLDVGEICITGGRSAVLLALLNKDAKEMVEFEATHLGVQFLLNRMDRHDDSYLLTNVGTGTSIHCIENNKQERVGGTGIGGGTFIGLSRLLTGVIDYEEMVSLARKGSRDRVDLKVKDIYEGKVPPISGDLTASNFGNKIFEVADQLSKEELLAAVIGLVGETVSTISVHAAKNCDSSTIIYIGSSFIQNPLLKEVVESYTVLRGAIPLFLENGEYSGAVGAMSVLL